MGHVAQSGGTAPAGCVPESTDLATICHDQVTPAANQTATEQALIKALTSIQTKTLTHSCP